MATTDPRKSSPTRPAGEPALAGSDVVTELEALEEGPAGAADEVFLVIRSDGGAARVIALAEGQEITIGRAPDAAVVVDDTRVSRAHARVRRGAGRLVLIDLGSRNGTRVNAEVVKTAERVLARSDVIRVGSTEIIVAVASKAEAHPGEDAALDADFVVADEAMVKVFQVVRRLARTETTVLVLGETGAGKEVVAEQIHRAGPRAGGPFVRLNCASIPEALLESELFGHEKAAFTGADRRKIGYLEAAQRGTLLLDEIGELPLAMQAKLLRAVETRRVVRVGGTQEIELDVRLVCATHRNLPAEVAAGRFRQDLYYRISTFVLNVPPLRERRAEIALLAHRFARVVAERMGEPPPTIAPPAMLALSAYSWPGNVRELRNAVEHAIVLADAGVIEIEHLPAAVQGQGGPADGAPVSASFGAMTSRVAELEKKSIEEALDAEGGNQTRAARRLGISRRGLIYKLEKYAIRR
jgi:two-component system, NtrC family, response regulator AtoC